MCNILLPELSFKLNRDILDKEQILVKKILRGNLNDFRELIENYQKLVGHIVFRLVHQPETREEIAQEVFIKVYQNLANFKFQSKLSTWIGRIAYNTTINYLRKEKIPLYEDIKPVQGIANTNEAYTDPLKSVEDKDSSPVDYIEERDRADLLKKQVEKLPVPYRTIITLYHLEQMSYQEISEIMDMPEGTVKSYLFRARKKLKDLLVSELQGEEI